MLRTNSFAHCYSCMTSRCAQRRWWASITERSILLSCRKHMFSAQDKSEWLWLLHFPDLLIRSPLMQYHLHQRLVRSWVSTSKNRTVGLYLWNETLWKASFKSCFTRLGVTMSANEKIWHKCCRLDIKVHMLKFRNEWTCHAPTQLQA